MEGKKDEVTVLNTDIEQPQKEEDRQNNKEQKHKIMMIRKRLLKPLLLPLSAPCYLLSSFFF